MYGQYFGTIGHQVEQSLRQKVTSVRRHITDKIVLLETYFRTATMDHFRTHLLLMICMIQYQLQAQSCGVFICVLCFLFVRPRFSWLLVFSLLCSLFVSCVLSLSSFPLCSPLCSLFSASSPSHVVCFLRVLPWVVFSVFSPLLSLCSLCSPCSALCSLFLCEPFGMCHALPRTQYSEISRPGTELSDIQGYGRLILVSSRPRRLDVECREAARPLDRDQCDRKNLDLCWDTGC